MKTRNLLKEHKALMSQLALAGYERVGVSPTAPKKRLSSMARIFMGALMLLCGWFSGIAISHELTPDQLAQQPQAVSPIPTGTVIQIPPDAGGVVILIFPHEEVKRNDQYNARAGFRIHRMRQTRMVSVRLLVRRDRAVGSRLVQSRFLFRRDSAVRFL